MKARKAPAAARAITTCHQAGLVNPSRSAAPAGRSDVDANACQGQDQKRRLGGGQVEEGHRGELLVDAQHIDKDDGRELGPEQDHGQDERVRVNGAVRVDWQDLETRSRTGLEAKVAAITAVAMMPASRPSFWPFDPAWTRPAPPRSSAPIRKAAPAVMPARIPVA